MKNSFVVLLVLLAVVTICGAVGWLLLIGVTHDFQKEVETLKAVKFNLQEEAAKKEVEPISAEYRLSCHELVSGDIVCDVYTATERAYCWWEEACRMRSLQSDRVFGGEGCVGYFTCSKDLHRIHNTKLGPEVGEVPRIRPPTNVTHDAGD